MANEMYAFVFCNDCRQIYLPPYESRLESARFFGNLKSQHIQAGHTVATFESENREELDRLACNHMSLATMPREEIVASFTLPVGVN